MVMGCKQLQHVAIWRLNGCFKAGESMPRRIWGTRALCCGWFQIDGRYDVTQSRQGDNMIQKGKKYCIIKD
jgi:hypothetical protein